MAQSASARRYRYTVDARDVITSVSASWLAFARENGAPELTEAAVVGRLLWDFIDGAQTIQLYQAVLRRVRAAVLRIVLPFRCDSPNLRRHMRLEISCKDAGSIQFDGILERIEPTSALRLLEPRVVRSQDSVSLCSVCKRILVATSDWLEIEDAAARQRLFDREEVPQVQNLVCPRCLDEVDALLSPGTDRNSGDGLTGW
jgi:hypothetical protein